MFGLPYQMPKPRYPISDHESLVEKIKSEVAGLKTAISTGFNEKDVEIIQAGMREARISEALFYSMPLAVGIVIFAFLISEALKPSSEDFSVRVPIKSLKEDF